MTGLSSARRRAGMFATRSPCHQMRSILLSVTSPITVQSRSQRSQTSRTSAICSAVTIASMRSWLSLIMISQGSMSASRRGTRSAWMSSPTTPLLAISLLELVRPAAPRSCMLTTSLRWISSRQASMSFFSVNGSPTWTLGRFSSSVSSNSWLASTLAPPMPSRPVLEPMRTTWLPMPLAMARTMPSVRIMPALMALTRQLPS